MTMRQLLLTALLTASLIQPTFCQIRLEQVGTAHMISVEKGDTLYLALTTENAAVQSFGRAVIFFQKAPAKDSIVLLRSFGDSYTFDYVIDDLDGDKFNDVMIIDKDETSYSITIYRVRRISGHFQVVQGFRRENLYLTHRDIPGTTNGIFRVQKKNGVVDRIVFFAGKQSGGYSSFYVRFMRATKKFEAIRTR